MKGITVTKIVKEINFGEVWGELKAQTCFQRQAFIRCLRLTLAFMRNGVLREKFNFCFSGLFASISKVCIWVGGLGAGLSLFEVLRLS